MQLIDGCIVIGPQRDDAALHAIAILAASLELHRRKLGRGIVRERTDLRFDTYNVRTPALAFFADDVQRVPSLVVEATNRHERPSVMQAKLERYVADFGVTSALGLEPQTRQVVFRDASGHWRSSQDGPPKLPRPLDAWDLDVATLWR